MGQTGPSLVDSAQGAMRTIPLWGWWSWRESTPAVLKELEKNSDQRTDFQLPATGFLQSRKADLMLKVKMRNFLALAPCQNCLDCSQIRRQ